MRKLKKRYRERADLWGSAGTGLSVGFNGVAKAVNLASLLPLQLYGARMKTSHSITNSCKGRMSLPFLVSPRIPENRRGMKMGCMLTTTQRRRAPVGTSRQSSAPKTGGELASRLGVTRQVTCKT